MSIWGFLFAVLESPNAVVKSRLFLHNFVLTRLYTSIKNVADNKIEDIWYLLLVTSSVEQIEI